MTSNDQRQMTNNNKQQTTNNDKWQTWTTLTNWTTLPILTDHRLIKKIIAEFALFTWSCCAHEFIFNFKYFNANNSTSCASESHGCKGHSYSWMFSHNDYNCNWNAQGSGRFQCDSSCWSDLGLASRTGYTCSSTSHPQALTSPCTGQTQLLRQNVLGGEDKVYSHVDKATLIFRFSSSLWCSLPNSFVSVYQVLTTGPVVEGIWSEF